MKNKEPLILAVVVFFSLLTYYLVEPYAHSQMHKHVESNHFDYAVGSVKFIEHNIHEKKNEIEDLTNKLTTVNGDEKLKKELETSLASAKLLLSNLETKLPIEKETWQNIEKISLLKGNVANGKELVAGAAACTGCHSIEVDGHTPMMEPQMAAASYGVNPPDLSNVGVVYDEKFLADLIINPAHALLVEHKFDPNAGKMHPMVAFYGAGGVIDQEVADMIAYLKSIAVSQEELTPAMAFENACGRCHAMKYENWTQIGKKPSFKHKKDSLNFDIKVLEYEDSIKAYMGKLPPDLSMYYRSRNQHFLETLIENPQSQLAGTAMPRVGVTKEVAEKVIEHMADAGDTKRHERESIAKNVMIYIVIFAIFALLWKKQVWKDLH